MKYNIIGGISQQHYHTIPQDIDVIKTSPVRDEIFQYLAHIGYEKFPEFIADVLVKTDGHKLIDITDGQGDEKRDVFTEKDAKKYLIQCKHTINYKAKSNGDDLDVLFSACMRKNCSFGLFVTNSDLTPQAKRYVHDDEYIRGFKGNREDFPEIDYWNGHHIWNKISTNSDILNKWFGGLGQVHGIRNFKFDLIFQKFPYSPQMESKSFDELVKLFSSKKWIAEVEKGLIYEADVNKDYKVVIKRWFQFPESLKINYVPPTEDINFFNRPYYSFSIEVIVKSDVNKFSSVTIRDQIAKFFGDNLLPKADEKSWWQIIATPQKSFIYLHDIGEPREVELAEANTYLKTIDHKCLEEIGYCLPNNKKFKAINLGHNDDDLEWIDVESNTKITLMFEQKIHPIEAYNHQIHQYNKISNIKNYMFKVVQNVDNRMMMAIRKLLHPEWVAFYSENSELFWAYSPETDKSLIEKHENKIKSLSLQILNVREEDTAKILGNVINDLNPPLWMTNSSLSSLSVPILLDKRTFWLSNNIEIKKTFSPEVIGDLFAYKFSYEKKHGFDNLGGDESKTINPHEFRENLFDFYTIRGNRMLDIATFKNPITINIRFKENKLEPANQLCEFYLSEFEKAFNEILDILDKHI